VRDLPVIRRKNPVLQRFIYPKMVVARSVAKGNFLGVDLIKKPL